MASFCPTINGHTMTDLYLGLGSNMGNRERILRRVVDLLQERIGEMVRLSAFYETEPWGFVSSHAFLNAAVWLRTSLSPQDVLHTTRQIERELGRTQKSTNGMYADRPVDIDILLYGDMVAEADFNMEDGCIHLSLPHPLMQERLFVMEPLAEIAPDTRHPVSGMTFGQICNNLRKS